MWGRRSGLWGLIAVCALALSASHMGLYEQATNSVSGQGEAQPKQGGATQLLVLVIAGGSKPVYQKLRSLWNEAADLVEGLGVVVYLVGMNSEIKQPQFDKKHRMLSFPGKDSLIPGVLEETVLAMDYIVKQKTRGSDFKFFLRTNLSSFWRFDLLLHLLSRFKNNGPLYAGYAYRYPGLPPFAAGAGYVLNREAFDVVLAKRGELTYKEIDDVAVGRLFDKYKITIGNTFSVCWVETPKVVKRDDKGGLVFPCSSYQFHFRIKTKEPEFDLEAWTFLLQKHLKERLQPQ